MVHNGSAVKGTPDSGCWHDLTSMPREKLAFSSLKLTTDIVSDSFCPREADSSYEAREPFSKSGKKWGTQ
jgi:hypothetical protein